MIIFYYSVKLKICKIVLYEIKMENQKKTYFFLSNWDFFVWNWEKKLFGIGNGAEFQPQNRVIKSPGQ